MTVIRKWDGTGVATGTTITTSTTGTGDNAFDKADAGFTVDAPGEIAVADAATGSRSEVAWLTGTLANYAVRFYFTCTGAAASTMIVRGWNTTGYATACWNIGFNSSGNTLRLVPSGTGVTWTAANPITYGTMYRVEMTVDSTGLANISVYVGDSTTVWDSGSGNVGALNLLSLSHGRCSGASTSTGLKLKHLAVADTATLIGPAGSGGSNGAVTAVAATGTAQATAPAVSATTGATVAAVVASATGTAPAPSVDVSTTTTGGGPATATAVAYPPTVTAQASAAVSAPAATGTAQAGTPTVDTSSIAAVTAPAATGTTQAHSPTVAAARNAAVAAKTAAANAQAYAPGITAGGSVTIQSVPATATLTAPTPAVTGQQIADGLITAVAATATLTAPAPVVAGHGANRDITIIAGPITIGWAAAAPTQGWTADPTTGNHWTGGAPSTGWSAGKIES